MIQTNCLTECAPDAIEMLRSTAPCSCKPSGDPFPAKHWTLDFTRPGLAEARKAAQVLYSCGYFAISARQISDSISVIFARCREEGLESIGISVPFCEATDALLLCPRGLLIAIFGPDGVGKSSIGSAVTGALAPLFDHQRTICWRPQLIRNRVAKEPHKFKLPHDGSLYSPVLSMLKLTGAFADFFLDHVTLTRNQLRGCTLIAWDRYLHDIAVDPKRYRYSGPRWYSDMALRCLPVPSHFLGVVLDADEEIILSRKRELPLEELQRQRLSYRQLAGILPQTYVIRNDSGFDVCLQRVLSLVIRTMAGWFGTVSAELLGSNSATIL